MEIAVINGLGGDLGTNALATQVKMSFGCVFSSCCAKSFRADQS